MTTAARKATYNRRYEQYAELCDEIGLSEPRTAGWTSHYAQLRRDVLRCVVVNADLIAKERGKYRRWWLERFTVEEIRDLGSGVYGLGGETVIPKGTVARACSYCRGEIPKVAHARPDREFCSDRCRKRHWRQRTDKGRMYQVDSDAARSARRSAERAARREAA